VGEPAKLPDLDQPGGGVDHDGTEGCRREGGQHRPEEPHGEQYDGHRHQGVQLGAAPDGVADHGPAAAAADREALEDPGRQVRRTEGQELLIAVDGVSVLGGEGARGHHVVGVADEGDADGRGDQAQGVDPREVRDRRRGQPRGHRPDHLDPEPLQAEDRDSPRREHHGDQGAGRARELVLHDQQHRQHHDAQQHSGQVCLVEAGHEGPELLDDRVSLGVDAGQLAQLADHHQDRDARHVADQHRS
jgi:hypothetical protein